MRKTKIGLFLVMCVAVLTMLLSGCGGSSDGYMSNVDPAQAEKVVLSAVNKALGTEMENNEALRSKADAVWSKVDGNGKIRLFENGDAGHDSDDECWYVWPMLDNDAGLDDNAKLQMIEITEEVLKQFENPSAELLARVKSDVSPMEQFYKLSSVCVTAKKIGGRVYVMYVTEGLKG